MKKFRGTLAVKGSPLSATIVNARTDKRQYTDYGVKNTTATGRPGNANE